MLTLDMTTTRKLIAVLLVTPAAAAAQDPSTWECESCPFEQGYRADLEAGATYVSEDAARFGNSTGYDKKGGYGNADGQGRYVSDGYRVDWYAEDLGLDSRVLTLEAGRQGSFNFRVGYSELPYRRFDTTETVFNASASDTITLPGGWVRAGLTDDMPQLSSSLRSENIGSDRQIVDIGADWQPAGDWRVFADFSRLTRDGIDITGGAGYTQASLLPRWIDYETDRIDAGVEYGTDRGSLVLAYYGSSFTNENPSLTWETPFTTGPGMESLRMATAPSSDFEQVSLSGAYRADTLDTVVAFTLASGSGEQDELLLPYTINPNVAGGTLPRSTLDGEVDTTHYGLTITSRPFSKGRVKVAYRYDERDNTTLQSDWSRVIVDFFSSNDIEQNIPYSFERSTFTVSGEFVTWKDIRLSGGWKHITLDRDFQEVAEQTIDEGWGQLRWRPLAWLSLRAKGGAEERDIDRYDESVAVSFGQNPLMRKYNLAYRYRSYGELVASVTPLESPLSFTLTALLADDRYNKSLLGMTDSEEMRATIDVNWSVSETSSIYLVLGHEVIDALQLGSEQYSVWDWSATHEDSFDHLGAGFRWRHPEGKIDLRFDYNRGDGETTIDVFSLSGGQSRLPDLTSTLDSVRVEALFRWSEQLEGTLDLRYERFELEDWALVSPSAMPLVLTLGADPYDYDVWALGIGFRYRFGDAEISLAN